MQINHQIWRPTDSYMKRQFELEKESGVDREESKEKGERLIRVVHVAGALSLSVHHNSFHREGQYDVDIYNKVNEKASIGAIT